MVRGRLCCGAVRGWRRIGFVGDFVAYIRSGAVRSESSVPKREGQDIGRSRLLRAHPSLETSEGWGTHFMGWARVGHPPELPARAPLGFGAAVVFVVSLDLLRWEAIACRPILRLCILAYALVASSLVAALVAAHESLAYCSRTDDACGGDAGAADWAEPAGLSC